jgi:hypothetical protein
MKWKQPDSKSFQERAEECRRLAKLAGPDLRKSFLALAESYESLAREAEWQSEGQKRPGSD